MARTIAVLRGLAEMCAVYETTEIIAIATAAVRDAVRPRIHPPRAGKDRSTYGQSRAAKRRALIYLGVSSGLSTAKPSGCSSTSAAAAPSLSWAIPSLRPQFAQLDCAGNLFFRGQQRAGFRLYLTQRCKRCVTRPCLLPAHRGFRDPRSRRQLRHNLMKSPPHWATDLHFFCGAPPRSFQACPHVTDCAARSDNVPASEASNPR